MTAYRPPNFNERAELSRQAKQRALDKLRAKVAPSAEELAQRKAARLEREAEALRLRAERTQAAKAAKQEAARAAAAKAAAEAVAPPVRTEADRKAERDARYAARKSRK